MLALSSEQTPFPEEDDEGSRSFPMLSPRAVILPRREGDAWVISDKQTFIKLKQVLELRAEAFTKWGLDASEYLPFAAQQWVQAQLRQQWFESDEGQRWMKHQSRGVTDDHDAISRMVTSAWRKQQYLDFGGAMWCNFVIALGEASDGLVDFVNDEQMAGMQANLQGKQRSQALAAAQGKKQKRVDRPHEELGIMHVVSEAKKAREAAKQLDKKIAAETSAWKSKMGWKEWNDLLASRDVAWDHAENLSITAGFKFKNRRGDWWCTEPVDIVGIVLRRWCAANGRTYT